MKPLLRLQRRPLAVCLAAATVFGVPLAVTGATPPSWHGARSPQRDHRAPLVSGVVNGVVAPPVTNCNDDGAGSLREAVLNATDGQVIDLRALACSTITLGSEIAVPSIRLDIYGPGRNRFTIDSNGTSRAFGGSGRLTLLGMRVTNGAASGSGGCLYSSDSIYLRNVDVSNCHAHTTTAQVMGGAVFAGDIVDMYESTVTSSYAESDSSYAKGGGVYAGYDFSALSSTIASNTAESHATRSFGGGVFIHRDASIVASTISANHAYNVGGISMAGGAQSGGQIISSTISGNIADGFMGGMYTNMPLVVADSTIAFNCATRTEVVPGYVSAIGLQAYQIAPTLDGTIVSNNDFCQILTPPEAPLDTAYDVGFYGPGTIGGSHNLIVASATPLPPDTLRSDPMLAPLADNGGPTFTHSLVSSSPAIDTGMTYFDGADQRGIGFARTIGNGPDIGAYERQDPGIVHQVSTCADSGPGSLRDGVASALSGDIIDLGKLSCSTITLTSGEIDLPQGSLRFVGPSSGGLTIDGSGLDRIFRHDGNGTLELDGLALVNGHFSSAHFGGGGCVESFGRTKGTRLVMDGCSASIQGYTCEGGALSARSVQLYYSRITNNACHSDVSQAFGGGVYGQSYVLLNDTTVAGNTASNDNSGVSVVGGGFFSDGSALIFASTISGNSASIAGGGYAVETSMIDSTVSGNTASSDAGGIATTMASLYNSTLAFNATLSANYHYAAGLYVLARADLESSILFGNTLGATPYDIGTRTGAFFGANNLVGYSPRALPPGTIQDDPLLGPLADNGGPTQTHMPLAGSPAIDAGNNDYGLDTDQRGQGFTRVSGAAADIGAIETQPLGDRIFANGFDGSDMD